MASSTCDEFARSRKNGHSDKRHSAQQRWARELSPLMGELIADHQYDRSRGYFTQGNDKDWRSTADGDDILVNSDLEETGSSAEISGHSEDEEPSGGGSQSMRRMGGHSSLPTSSHKERGQPMHCMGCQTVAASHGRDGKASGFSLGKEAPTPVTRGISQRDAHPSVRKKGSSMRRLSQSPPKALNQIVSQDEDEEDDVLALWNRKSSKKERNLITPSPKRKGKRFSFSATSSPVQPRRLSFSPELDFDDLLGEDVCSSGHASIAGSSNTFTSNQEVQDGVVRNPRLNIHAVSFDLSATNEESRRVQRDEMYRHRESMREGRPEKRKIASESLRRNPVEQQKLFCKDKLARDERAVFLDGRYIGTSQNMTYLLRCGSSVCRRTFMTIYCLGGPKLTRIQNLSSENPTVRDSFVREKTAEGFMLQEWLDRFFLTHCERQPNAQIYHLPSNLSKAEVYDYYKTEMMTGREGYSTKLMSLQSLTLYWRRYYPLVTIPKHNTFTGCDLCEQMKHDRDTEPPGRKKDEAVLGLKLHRQQQGEERATSGRRHNKSLHCHEEAAYISIDGMDQNKTILPHFEGPLPPTLYIQLDNIVRENKNANVFAYLAMLIDKKIFRKIKVGFLMVGHTHDHVDQMFSRFSVALRKRQAFTMPELRMVIQESYSPSPSFEVLEETWDFKNILQT
ncbi:hypothetical protein R1sor_011454 [Riccia sorocarpa]|uniref:DUF7869 domain-containing protein n=1 Tax=Riccia sorocarpa TaxID=122646 RepID=A0ABD3I0Y2_9MARC